MSERVAILQPLTDAEFLEAARLGKGRALMALRAGTVTPTFNQIRRLTLRRHVFDRLCESYRGWYTVELIRASGHEPALIDLLHKLLHRKKGNSMHRSHLVAVVEELALRGDSRARQALYDGFDPADDYRFADEIIAVDGIDGLDWILSKVPRSEDPDHTWRVRWWVEDAQRAVGKEAVAGWLGRETSTEYRRLLKAAKPRKKKQRMAADTLEEYQRRWPLTRSRSSLSWVASSSKEEVAKAWQELRTSEDADWIRSLARGLRHKPENSHAAWLIERARRWVGEDNPFVLILEKISDPEIRSVGIEFLQEGRIWEGLSLLELNAEPGDEVLTLQAAGSAANDEDRHAFGLSLLRIAERISGVDSLLWVYDNTPCSFCRESAVRDIAERHRLPPHILDECRYDCVEDTRQIASVAKLMS